VSNVDLLSMTTPTDTVLMLETAINCGDDPTGITSD
jgi:hypothetical protein